MDVIEKEDLMNRAHVLGERFKNGLNSLMKEHELIGDVRGRGLFLGVEMVKDRSTLEPAAMEASEIVSADEGSGGASEYGRTPSQCHQDQATNGSERRRCRPDVD